jgi:hypothetical protein
MKRGGPLARKTPLVNKAPMNPGKPLARTTPMPAGTGRSKPKPTKSRSSTTTEARVKTLVDARDGERCQNCGRHCPTLFSRQHRIPRGAGGTRRDEVHGVANRVRLCGSATSPGCHRRAEDRDPEMIARGYCLPLNGKVDPSTVPVRLFTGDWVLLDDEGGWVKVPDPESMPPG